MELLPLQREIINYGEGNVIVSASAGSGKTFVMIERIKRLILERKAQVRDILAITYVKTAAAEMKEKLARAISEEISRGADAQYLSLQLKDLPSASVSTMHSFCADLLRSWFFVAGLDPAFVILDENESAVLKKRAINDVFDKYYERNDEEFKKLIALFAVKRKDDSLKKYIVKLYDFLNSEDKPLVKLKEWEEYYSRERFDEVAKELMQSLKEELEIISNRQALLLKQLCAYSQLKKAELCGEEILETAKNISAICEPFELCRVASGICLDKFPVIKLKEKKQIKLKDAQLNLKKEFSKWLENAAATLSSREEEIKKCEQSRLVYRKLAEITEMFAEEYDRLKEERTGLDFSDLEHKASALLDNSDVAKSVREKYKYVFADEYQDVNGVQEKILSSLSNGNLFMVGDVKQCIYAFRGCNPDIFADKFAKYSKGEGAAFRLDSNFRCSDQVIEAVNKTFSGVMTKENSRVDYAEQARLKSGGLYGEYRGEAALHIIERGKKPRETELPRIYSVAEEAEKCEPAASYTEGRFIAELVQNLVGKMFYDIKEGKARAVSYADIVVLCRNMRGFADGVLCELKKSGIPASVETRAGVTDFPEIKLLIEFLKVVDNPDNDIPLAAVMLSAIGNFTADELIDIRRRGSADKSLYYNCKENLDINDTLSRKIDGFLKYILQIRTIQPALKAAGILRRVIADKNLDAYFLSQKMGAQRLKRIERFIAESNTGAVQLSAGEFLRRIEDAGESFTAAEAASGESVRIMSIHSSKGLEFPVVIMAGLSKKFNINDSKEEILKDREFGFGLKYYDTENMKKSDTSVRKLIKNRLKKAAVREELRILYVAMTRARYSLHIICDNVAPDGFCGKAERFADFLDADNFQTYTYQEGEAISEAGGVRKILISEADKELTDKILQNIDYEYPYKISSAMPLKRTVTQLNESGFKQYEKYGLSQSAKRGTNFHIFMQHADFDKISQNEIKEQIIGLVKREIIESSDGIDTFAAQKIFESDLFCEIKRGKVYREKQFLLNVSSADIFEGGTRQDDLIVQGVIDLFSVTENGAILVDYKLTSIKNDEDIKEKYRTQLEIYKTAIEKFYGINVVKMAIINLSNSKIIYF